MKVSEIRSKTAAAERRLARLRPWIKALEEARKHTVRKMDPEAADHDAHKIRAQLREIDHGAQGDFLETGGNPALLAGWRERLPGLIAARDEVVTLEEQVLLLADALPSEDEVRQARKEAQQKVEDMRDAVAEYDEHRSELFDSLGTMEAVCLALMAAKKRAVRAGSQVRSIDEDFGLDLPEAPADKWPGPALSAAEERMVYTVAELLRHARGFGIPDGLKAEIQHARERLASEAGEAKVA